MSCLILENLASGTLAVGTLIVVDSGKARAYDGGIDAIEDVIGVAYATVNTSGRAWRVGDGPDYYLNDNVLWNENLQFQVDEDDNPVNNDAFAPWNPFADTAAYTCVLYNGFAAIPVATSTVPARWRLLRSGAEYNWYLLR